jgi:hypothetical protein
MVVGVSSLLYFIVAWYALPAFRELVATGLKVAQSRTRRSVTPTP